MDTIRYAAYHTMVGFLVCVVLPMLFIRWIDHVIDSQKEEPKKEKEPYVPYEPKKFVYRNLASGKLIVIDTPCHASNGIIKTHSAEYEYLGEL